MAIAVGLGHSTLPHARPRRGAPPPHDPCSCLTGGEPRRIRPCRATLAALPPPLGDDDELRRKGPLDPALLLASFAAAAAAAVTGRHAALAASGGAMGGRSYSSSSRSSPASSSSSSFSSSSSSSWSSPTSSSSSSSSWSSPSSSSSSSSSTSSSSESWPSSSTTSSWPEQQTEATHESVGTAQPPPVLTAAERGAATRFWTGLASASVSAVALFLAVLHHTRPRTTVVKLQVALLGLAKSFQKDLNEIAEKVEASNQRWYRFILTETICSLRRHNNCCISSSLSADVKDRVDSWEQHFDKISIEERRKFDEETLYNLEGIKRKKTYTRKFLLASFAAAAAVTSRHAALAASGGAMGGRSYSSSSRSSSPASSSSSSPFSDSSSSSSWSSPSSSSSSSTSWSSPSSSSSSSTSSPSTPWPSSSTSSWPEQQTEATIHESVGTAQPPPVLTAAERDAATRFWTGLASASVSAVALFLAVRHHTRPRTTVVKLQVALLGLAKSFQKDLNEIAEKVEASNQRWYKFILTETICSLRRHNNCCISSSLSVDVKDRVDSWEQHFDRISIEERSKFDEETLYNLEGIKRNKTYSRKPDGFRNEYIVLTILVAADGALKLPEVRNYADLEAAVEKLNSIPARQIQGIQVLWTPQDENDVLSEEKLLEDYPYLTPLCDD